MNDNEVYWLFYFLGCVSYIVLIFVIKKLLKNVFGKSVFKYSCYLSSFVWIIMCSIGGCFVELIDGGGTGIFSFFHGSVNMLLFFLVLSFCLAVKDYFWKT